MISRPNSEQLDLFPDIPPDTIDILHVKVGLNDLGGKPWIPSQEELEIICELWEAIVPKGMKVIATPIGQEAAIIKVKNER
jgi:hypothetical protein